MKLKNRGSGKTLQKVTGCGKHCLKRAQCELVIICLNPGGISSVASPGFGAGGGARN